jgi:hypothetical protein
VTEVLQWAFLDALSAHIGGFTVAEQVKVSVGKAFKLHSGKGQQSC